MTHPLQTYLDVVETLSTLRVIDAIGRVQTVAGCERASDTWVAFCDREMLRVPFDHEAVCGMCSLIYQRDGMSAHKHAPFCGLLCEACFEIVEEDSYAQWEALNAHAQ